MATATESLDEATFELLGAELGYRIQIVSPEDEDRALLAQFNIDLDAEIVETLSRAERPFIAITVGTHCSPSGSFRPTRRSARPPLRRPPSVPH